MKGKLLQRTTALILVLCMTMVNFLFVATNIVYAVSGSEVSVESGKIKFDAYFKDGAGNKTYTKEANISEGATLYANIKLESGILKDAVIKINNANFKLPKVVDSDYVAEINDATKEIKLKELDGSYVTDIVLEIPVSFEKQSTISVDYFDMVNGITLSGKYFTSENGKDISATIETNLEWTDIQELSGTQHLSEAIDKAILTDGRLLIQEKVTSAPKNLPKTSETIKITVPSINGKTPSEVYVLVNGQRNEVQLNGDKIEFTKTFKNGNTIDWSHDIDVYKFVYIYEDVEGVTSFVREANSVEIKTEIATYNISTAGKSFPAESEEITLDKGVIVSVSAKSLSENVYKGFMYANSINGTDFEEEYNIEISDKELINKIQLESVHEAFTGSAPMSKVIYKTLTINENNFLEILGEEGKITVTNGEGQIIKVIDNNTITANETENIVADINSNILNITTTKPISEGTLILKTQKQIQGDAGLTREQIQEVSTFEGTIKVTTNIEGKVSEGTAKTELKEPQAKPAELTMSTGEWATSNVNNVEFTVKLATGTQDTYLFSQPTITLQLPEDVTGITDVTAKALFAENNELDVANEKIRVEGNKIIIPIEGTQSYFDNQVAGGIVVTINAKIQLNKFASSKLAEIVTSYTNENALAQAEATTTRIKIQSPENITTESKIDGKNGVMTFSTTIANILNKTVENIAIVSAIQNKEVSQEDLENSIRTTFEAAFTNSNYTGIEISYSKDKQNWTNQMADANYYKIAIKTEQGGQLASEEILNVKYTLNNVEELNPTFQFVYTINGAEETIDFKPENTFEGTQSVVTPTEEPQVEPQETQGDKLSVAMSAVSGNKEFANGDEIFEGQTITYTYKFTNNTEADIENVKFAIDYKGTANIYQTSKEEQANTAGYTENLTFVSEEESDKTSAQLSIDKIEAGKTKTIKYQVRVKEGVQALKSEATITADDIEQIKINAENPVKEAILKLEYRTGKKAEGYQYENGVEAQNILTIKNTSNELLEDVVVSVAIPKEFSNPILESYGTDETEGYTIISSSSEAIVFKIDKIAAKNNKQFRLSIQMSEANPTREEVEFGYSAKTANGDTYYSNNISLKLRTQLASSLQAAQVTNIKEDTVKTGDNLKYSIQIKNVGQNTDEFTIKDEVPIAAVIKKVTLKANNEETEITNIEDNYVIQTVSLEPGKVAELLIETEIDEEKTGREEITNKATISGIVLGEEITTNEITHKLAANVTQNPSTDDPENPGTDPQVDPNNPDVPTIPGTVTTKNSISGIAWVDTNKNGVREASEPGLAGVKVYLANVQTKEYVKDSAGKKLEEKTSSDGKYQFSEVEPGKYMVIFEYDNVKYRNTQYQVTATTDNTNSDIITKEVNLENGNVKYGVTNTLELSDKSLENIDAGFIENEIFDLKLNKYITKVTVQNSAGTVVKEYEKSQLAKLEIDAKQLASSTVLVEYTIEVTNEGELAGYANEIVDYMPKDLSFSSEINKQWYKSTDGNVHTTALAKELINPGETKQVVLTLTKTMTENNTGLTTNKAEIAKSTNDLSIADVDSTAGNNAQGEDDISTAELIISIRTGVEFTIGIISAIVAIAVVGIIVYTKKRKGAKYDE